MAVITAVSAPTPAPSAADHHGRAVIIRIATVAVVVGVHIVRSRINHRGRGCRGVNHLRNRLRQRRRRSWLINGSRCRRLRQWLGLRRCHVRPGLGPARFQILQQHRLNHFLRHAQRMQIDDPIRVQVVRQGGAGDELHQDVLLNPGLVHLQNLADSRSQIGRRCQGTRWGGDCRTVGHWRFVTSEGRGQGHTEHHPRQKGRTAGHRKKPSLQIHFHL